MGSGWSQSFGRSTGVLDFLQEKWSTPDNSSQTTDIPLDELYRLADHLFVSGTAARFKEELGANEVYTCNCSGILTFFIVFDKYLPEKIEQASQIYVDLLEKSPLDFFDFRVTTAQRVKDQIKEGLQRW